MRFRLIEDQRDVWPVRVICDALSVSPSGFYAWRSRPESPRKIANRELLVDIRRVHAQHRMAHRAFTPNYAPKDMASAASGSRGSCDSMASGRGRRAAIESARPTASIRSPWR